MKANHRTPRGLVAYRGPSEFNGDPILGVLVFSRDNGKTNSPALWVLPDVQPEEGETQWRAAYNAGRSVCGGCPLFSVKDDRGKPGTGCFAWGHALPIGGVYKSLKAGNYVPDWDLYKLKGYLELNQPRRVRTAYIGDPAAIPQTALEPWLETTGATSGMLGYTHQWRRPSAQWLRSWAMASVESLKEAEAARAMGWGTFRVGLEDEEAAQGEIWCPSQDKGMTCNACGMCDGKSQRAIYAKAHGASFVTRRAQKVIRKKSG